MNDSDESTSDSTSETTSEIVGTSNISVSPTCTRGKELVRLLKDEECIVEGFFKLKNGEDSRVYYDIKSIISNPLLFRLVCDNLMNCLPAKLYNFSLIFGIPYGGLPIASYLSITNNKGLIYSRSKKKTYGTKKLIEGRYKPGQKVVIIDDVITTGGSLAEAVKLAKETLKLRVVACLAVVNRSNLESVDDIPVFSLINSCI